jgi:hypothetical protein
MAASRPTPFDLVFGDAAPERFPALQRGLAAAGRDPRDRDAFALVREVLEFLRELRPDEGLGGAVDGLVAFVHCAYLFWLDGRETAAITEARLTERLAGRGQEPAWRESGRMTYVQLPPLRVWGTPVAGGAPEPLDGWFVRRTGPRLSLLAIFGLHPGREGLTAVPAEGARPDGLRREDGTPPFAPLLDGGAAAGLHSVADEAELLELAWRMEDP